MIVLDTNVVSELIRPRPHPAIPAWVNSQRRSNLYIAATTVAELMYGVLRMPAGRRRTTVEAGVRSLLDESFPRRVLSYDRDAAAIHADIAVSRERIGRPIDYPDAQIAAICRARNATLATRNVTDFEGTGVELVNPWD